jgi:hypothetical protein
MIVLVPMIPIPPRVPIIATPATPAPVTPITNSPAIPWIDDHWVDVYQRILGWIWVCEHWIVFHIDRDIVNIFIVLIIASNHRIGFVESTV